MLQTWTTAFFAELTDVGIMLLCCLLLKCLPVYLGIISLGCILIALHQWGYIFLEDLERSPLSFGVCLGVDLIFTILSIAYFGYIVGVEASISADTTGYFIFIFCIAMSRFLFNLVQLLWVTIVNARNKITDRNSSLGE